jgi:dUTP pyrophosphatase
MNHNEYNITSNELDDPGTFNAETNIFEQDSLRYYSEGEPMTQGSTNAAGLDLKVNSLDHRGFIGTGIYCQIPTGWVGLVVPRSSLGLKGFRLRNTLGVIDSDYRGEIKLAYEGYTPELGDRVAQLVLVPHYVGNVERMVSMDDLKDSSRGDGGFGSTGT